MRGRKVYNPHRDEILRMWSEVKSFNHIAGVLKLTRNQVAGVISRARIALGPERVRGKLRLPKDTAETYKGQKYD